MVCIINDYARVTFLIHNSAISYHRSKGLCSTMEKIQFILIEQIFIAPKQWSRFSQSHVIPPTTAGCGLLKPQKLLVQQHPKRIRLALPASDTVSCQPEIISRCKLAEAVPLSSS